MVFDRRFNAEELKQFIQSKYGSGVQVEVFPKAQQEGTEEEADKSPKAHDPLAFHYKPSDIKNYLDRFVIQQDEAKKVLATAICDHYHHIQQCRSRQECLDYKKQNIVLIGPTGVGKTYLVQNIARLIGVPFVKADATKYSETGYVGGDVEDLIRELVHQADGDIQLAEYGIVYLDEIDKIASSHSTVGRDVSGHGVQRGLLKLMEETEVPLRSPTDVASQMQAFMEFQSKGKVEKKTISTKHILFIVSGAFTGLPELIRKRIGSKQIGFLGDRTSPAQDHFLLSRVRSVDFIEYGFEAELVGRLPVVVHCNPLSVNDLFNILRYSEGSLLRQYRKDFQAYQIDAYFTDDAMRAIAEKAQAEETGARGLMTVCERIFRDYKYHLPDHEVTELVVTRPLVEDPEETLSELLRNPTMFRSRVLQFQLSEFEKELLERFDAQVSFTPEAAEALSSQAERSNRGLLEHCRQLFSAYEHGLNLLKNRPEKGVLVLDEKAVHDLASTLESWIREAYQK